MTWKLVKRGSKPVGIMVNNLGPQGESDLPDGLEGSLFTVPGRIFDHKGVEFAITNHDPNDKRTITHVGSGTQLCKEGDGGWAYGYTIAGARERIDGLMAWASNYDSAMLQGTARMKRIRAYLEIQACGSYYDKG